MKKFSVLFLFVTIVFGVQLAFGQDVSPFVHYKKMNPKDSSKLYFRFENLNFIKNNEYGSNFSKGATWIGYLLTPKLVYSPSKDFRLEAGVRLQKYSGRDNFTKSAPVFSAIYQPNSKLALILGSLNQDHNHNLSEPMFEPERYFMAKGENGVQMLYHSSQFHMQSWINWERFILENDPFQERFTFGLSGKWQLNHSQETKFFVPFEVMFAHRGGEIDSSDASVQTLGNFASGLQLEKNLQNSRLKSWYVKTMIYYFSDNSSEKEFVYDNGHAIYAQIGLNSRKSSVRLGYWNGYRFASSRGSVLFRSIAVDGSLSDRRELFTLKYYYDQKITKGIHFGAKLDFYYDINKSTSDYATAVYLRINGDFFLKKLKWQ